jgi:hypothetical protein
MLTRFETKPRHPDGDDTLKGLKIVERESRRREIERLIETRGARGKGRAMWLDSLNHRAEVFFKDLDRYVDFCIARFLVWRELRRERKRKKRGETKE